MSSLSSLKSRPCGLGRRLCVSVHAKKKQVHAKIAQNHGNKNKLSLDLDRLYTDKAYEPKAQLGNVALSKLGGSGRGIVTTASVIPSEALLVSEAMQFETAARGNNPLLTIRPEHLIQAFRAKQLSEPDRFRLWMLYDRTDSPARATMTLEQLLHAEDTVKKLGSKIEAAKKGFGAAAPSGSAPWLERDPAAEDQQAHLEDVVKLNSYGHPHSDLGAAPIRGEPAGSFIGLWPELAMVNHSCAPNSVAVLVGSRIVLRATKEIQKGAEVTVSYLDELAMVPLQERRSFLQAAYGFKCQCVRCKLEEQQPEDLRRKMHEVYGRIKDQDFQTKARSVVNAKDTEGVRKLEAELAEWAKEVEDKMAGVPAEVQPWMKGSMYALYELLSLCRDLGKESEPGEPAKLAAIQALIAPGSDAHLFLTTERLLRAGAIAKQSPETEAAAKECILAHAARYGPVTDDMLTKLMDTRSQVDNYMGRYSIAA